MAADERSLPAARATADSARPGRSFRRRVVRLLIIAVATYAGVCAVLYVFQRRLVYFPTRQYDLTPGDVGLEFEDLTLTTADGVAIAAWYVQHPQARGSVLHCHGNAGNMSGRVDDLLAFHQMGYSVLLFDYRGYGRSEGRPDEQGTYEDAEAARRFLVEEKGESPQRLIIFGRSLGGAVAIELARRHRPAALIVEASFTNLPVIGQRQYPFVPVKWLSRFHYDSINKVGGISCPKLFIHASEDELVPFDNGRRLYEAAAQPRQFIKTPGGHNTGGFLYAQTYLDQLERFLGQALRRRADRRPP